MLCVFSLLILSNRASTLSNRALIHDRILLNSASVVTANIMTSPRVAVFLASSEMISDIVRTMFWLFGAVLLSCICDPFAEVMCKGCVRG